MPSISRSVHAELKAPTRIAGPSMQFTESCQLFAAKLVGLTLGLNQTGQPGKRDNVCPCNAGRTADQLFGSRHCAGGQWATGNAQEHGNGRTQIGSASCRERG